MSNEVQFDLETQPQQVVEVKISKFAQFVIRHSHGMIKGENTANIFLIALACIFLVISSVIFFSENKKQAMSSQEKALQYMIAHPNGIQKN